MQLVLSATTKSLELETSFAGSVHVEVSYCDITDADASNPTDSQFAILTASTTTIVSAPAASTSRKIQYLNVYNNGVTQVITLKKDVSGVETILCKVTLQNQESFRIVNDKFTVLDSSGREKQQNAEQATLTGMSNEIYKIGTAPKAAGTYYATFKDSGFPGAWTLATPGLNGVNIDGSSTTFAGLIGFQNPSSGAMYYRNSNISATVQCGIRVVDLLWHNTGLVVTTTTAQAITQPALPARDVNGSSNGEGVYCGIYFSATSTNGAVANTTLQYTNSQGVAGRVATIASVNAAATIGQLVLFQLQAGDTGIRSISGITLGTTYVTGSISILCFRFIDSLSMLGINSGASGNNQNLIKDVRLYNGSALAIVQLANNTTATTFDGQILFVNK